jgi:drug/metabolite transporter (DMT)-like permease
LMPVLAGAFYAAGAVMTRRLCADETTSAMLVNMFATMGVFGVVGLAVMHYLVDGAGFFTMGWQDLTPRFLGLTLMQAVGSLVAVACIVRSYQIAEPSYVAVFEYLFLLFAVFWGYMLWGDLPSVLGFAGLALIIGAGAVIVLRSERTEG